MTTVAAMETGLSYMKDKPISALVSRIQSSVESIQQFTQQSLNRQALREQGAADRNFFEGAKKVGGDSVKSREQTLQEFVLYFFLASALFLGAAFTITTYVSAGAGSAFRMFLLYSVGMLVLCAILLRYA